MRGRGDNVARKKFQSRPGGDTPPPMVVSRSNTSLHQTLNINPMRCMVAVFALWHWMQTALPRPLHIRKPFFRGNMKCMHVCMMYNVNHGPNPLSRPPPQCLGMDSMALVHLPLASDTEKRSHNASAPCHAPLGNARPLCRCNSVGISYIARMAQDGPASAAQV